MIFYSIKKEEFYFSTKFDFLYVLKRLQNTECKFAEECRVICRVQELRFLILP